MLIPRTLRLSARLGYSFSQHCRRFSSLKILYFGTDSFSLPSLKLLSDEKLSRLEVVTSFKANNNPIKTFAESNTIKVYDWAELAKDENYKICKEFDLGVVVSFGHMIPENIINSFEKGMLNVHASLLPKYRGASPIIYAIRNGEKKTGVSIMRIRPRKFDVGEVLASRSIAIGEETLMPELHSKLSAMGAELLVECVNNLEKFQPVEQNSREASHAPKIDNKFCEVRWDEMSSKEVFNLYRSIYSFKNILTTFGNEPVRLVEIAKTGEINPYDHRSLQPGQLAFCKKTKKLLVKCCDDQLLEIKQLSIRGRKKVMSPADFNNGFLKKCEDLEKRFK